MAYTVQPAPHTGTSKTNKKTQNGVTKSKIFFNVATNI